MTRLLLSALLLLLFLSFSDASPSSTTVAISHSTATVCGVLASADPRSILCSSLSSPPFSLSPNASFSSVSGGRDFLCGLSPGGDTPTSSSIFCWSPATNYSSPSLPPKRLYGGPATLSELAVGEDHVAAVEPGVGVHFWRGGGRFPEVVEGNFTSLTSGDGFSCAISNGTVKCWGNQKGQAIEKGFSTIPMSTIVAGGSRACGMSTIGVLICKGIEEFQNITASPFEFSGLAVGATHTCAIRRANGTVVCWAGAAAAGFYSPAGSTSFEAVVAGGNLTCGLTSQNFSVLCWDLKRPSPPLVSLPLPPVLPGVCRNDTYSCGCGVFPDYEKLCSGTGIICKSCDAPDLSNSPPPVPSPPVVGVRRKAGKGFLAFAIVGSVGGLAGVCTVAYCVVVGVCRQKKVHNSVQPTIGGAASGANGNSPPVPPDALFSSPSKSIRSRSKSLLFLRQGSRIMRRQRSGPSSSRHERAEEFTLMELAEATGNFAAEAKIGAGSFGTVYRGRLSDGREVAIKRSETGPWTNRFQEKESAFQSELAFLSRLHHKHLVGLVGFCEEREERLLVYEFMKNGALYDHLHSKTETTARDGAGAGAGGVLNSWKMRIKVLLDASRGIEYLHSYAVPPIIHRDIKSSNILLDANWTARVSDFGLSLNGPESDGGHILMNAAGTVGYMDPEYYGLYHLTVKSDVYGLGVVMLEALTGKRAVFKEGDGEPMSVVDYAVPRIAEGDVAKVLDPRVAPPGPREVEAVELVAYTAMHCVRAEGKERPTMTDVVANLGNALAQLDHSHGSISSASITSYD